MPTQELQRRCLSTQAAAEYLGVAASSLEKDRVLGTLKIPFIKIGRRVVYDIESLDAVLASRQRVSTSDPAVEAS